MGLHDALLAQESRVREVLGRGFYRLVVFDAARGLNEASEFELDRFVEYATKTMIAAFGIDIGDIEYHPELLTQILKDEPRSLFCFLNIDAIPDHDLRRLRGFTQGSHQVLLCGRHEFGGAARDLFKSQPTRLTFEVPDVSNGVYSPIGASETPAPADSSMQDVVEQVPLAVHNSGPDDIEDERTRERVRIWLEFTRSLSGTLDLDEVLQKILDGLFRVFLQADRGFIILRDTPYSPLIPKAVKHRRSDQHGPVRFSRTVVNRVMEAKEAILTADAASDSSFALSESIADFRIRSMMCAPLISSEGSSIGYLQIDTGDQQNRFQEDDLEFLVSLVSVASKALESARRRG